MKEILDRYNIIWEGVGRPNDEELKQVIEEVEEIAEKMESPSSLMFHTVILGDIDTGPAVVVNGMEGDDNNFYATYYAEIEWESINHIEE